MNGRREGRGGGRGAGRAAPLKGAPFLLGFPEDGDSDDDTGLEAELLAITGGNKAANNQKPKGKTPLPMEHIERMAALCMQDVDENVDEDVEDDEDLMAELEEVLGEEKEEPQIISPPTKTTSSSAGGIEATLMERLVMYKEAMGNAKQAGEGTKARRYERGVKTLEDLLRTAKKGGSISSDDIPPPVAVGKSAGLPTAPPTAVVVPDLPVKPSPPANVVPPQPPLARAPPPVPVKPQSLPQPVTLSLPVTSSKPVTPNSTFGTSSTPATPSPVADGNKARVLERQRLYKLAALKSKQEGDAELASKYYRIAKSLDPMLSALDSGLPIDLNSLPPPPADEQPPSKPSVPQSPVVAESPVSAGPPPPPKDLLEALQQRMERYRSAAEQAKGKGDDRKARMHERIVKQYQDAIRSHKAGKPVNVSELPVPPGFPPIEGSNAVPAEQSLVGVLETAMKLANQQDEDGDDDDDDDDDEKGKASSVAQKPVPRPGGLSQPQPAAPKTSPSKSPKPSGKAEQQLQFLEGRKKQLMAAALRSKQHKDIEGAKMFLRQAKGLDPMLEAARGGLPVDITKVPPAPTSQADFSLDPHRKGGVSAQNSEKYNKLIEQLKKQHEMCTSSSQQFTHLGNITETAKYEKLAEECMKYIEIVKQAHARGLPVPHCHYEERTVSVVKILPDLTTSDLVLNVSKAMNLPIPAGSSQSDMDTFVRFEFAYPSTEEAQRDKTNVIKGTNSPVFKEKFNLQINRNHRGLKRAIQAKGIKFEVIQKGGLFKSDRVLGTAHLKLETMENSCEIRDILEVMDGRKPSGGKLEVCAQIREPLTSQQLSSTTEKWLVVEPISLPPVTVPKPKQPAPNKSGGSGSLPNAPTLHSLSVLAYEKEKLEKKIQGYRQQHRNPPEDLVALLNDVSQRGQQQIQQLRKGGPALQAEYIRQLERYLQFYSDSARRLGQEGNRDGAKEALFKRNLVGNELQKMSR
ncbi:PREDICTED: coiled-coil and C2 domain-containing protein 1A [Nanorana parkeri]|uniref:coiled-coil and C2 domain-containing protein 1A n=1 Tax=Nanorana parkeri TaxID=125878 RepID=UPI000854B4C0|nr:PREDICTED: coiled-coil and C2 domain-containing protein 1A [Nanorana parkeri]